MRQWLLLPLLFGIQTPALSAKELKLRVTAYCAGPCARCGTTGVTATGRDARRTRGVAVSASSRGRAVPLGRKVFLQGQGWLPVDDTGGGVRSNQLDLRFRRHSDARRWGTRVLPVKVKR
jgi:3D (Asp-Asp-Asp) domain-containing protein